MAYTINLTDGTIFATVADGTINTSSSMVLVGKNYAGYGEFLDENFIHLLESGANTTAPGAPLTGQLWWDKSTNTMKVYNGTTFKTISAATASASTPTSNVTGDLWFDTTNQQLTFIRPDVHRVNECQVAVDYPRDRLQPVLIGAVLFDPAVRALENLTSGRSPAWLMVGVQVHCVSFRYERRDHCPHQRGAVGVATLALLVGCYCSGTGWRSLHVQKLTVGALEELVQLGLFLDSTDAQPEP